MKINIPQFNSQHSLAVYKCEVRGKPHWVIYQYDEDANFPHFVGRVSFGRIVYTYLDKIKEIKVDQNIDKSFINDNMYADSENRLIWEVPRIKYDEADYEDWLHFSNEMIKLINSRDSGKSDYKELLENYHIAKHFAYIFTNRNALDSDIFDEVIDNGDAYRPREYKTLFNSYGYHILEDGLLYSLRTVEDYEALFMLDLWELLFNPDVSLKFKICKECNCCYESADNRTFYCPECKKNKGKRRYAQRMAEPISQKRKQIQNLLYQRLLKAKNENYSNTPSPDIKRIQTQLYDFQDEVSYYVRKIKGMKVEYNSNYDNTIDTEEKLLQWLINYHESIKRKGKNNGTTPETS